MTESRPRGRPRSEGKYQCGRCGRMAAKIRVHWPDGPVCGICFTTALRTRGSCPECAQDRLLPGRNTAGTSICRDCAGITTNMTCDGCGTETERFRAGLCIRCVLRTDLNTLLRPTAPPDLSLKRLISILAEAQRPESIYTWTRGTHAKDLLTGLGTRDIAISHAALDALPQSRAVEYLRELLVHHGMLPYRDRQLAAFERWLDDRLQALAETPSIHKPVERFARWHHLPRLRAMTDPGKNLNIAVRSAKQEITETGKFLAWLHADHELSVQDLKQAHLDEYWAAGPTTRHAIRTFVIWLIKNKEIPKLEVPHRPARNKPLITQARRIELIRTCLESADKPAAPRVAGLILLLYAQPISKIAGLTLADLEARPDGLYLRLGNIPVLVPSQLAGLFWQYLNSRPNQQTGNSNSKWLFPGIMPGQHMHADALMGQLRSLGINLGGARNTALRDLVQELQPTLVANALGYSHQVVHKHSADAAIPMAGYAGRTTSSE